jgi:hypothetical protein
MNPILDIVDRLLSCDNPFVIHSIEDNSAALRFTGLIKSEVLGVIMPCIVDHNIKMTSLDGFDYTFTIKKE